MRYLILLSLFLSACSIGLRTRTELLSMTNETGFVKVHVATRGSYQYLLYTDSGNRYLPASPLPEALKHDGQRVIFSGSVLPEKATIFAPSPTDAPIPDFEVHKILLTQIEAE